VFDTKDEETNRSTIYLFDSVTDFVKNEVATVYASR
jgi:hypothetical protein